MNVLKNTPLLNRLQKHWEASHGLCASFAHMKDGQV